MTRPSTIHLQRLIYRSRPQTTRLRRDLDSILSVAVWANARHRITGVLGYSDHAYVQCLEGPPEHLDRLLDCLLRDTRHTDLKVLERRSVATRLFPGWSLAKAPLTPGAMADLERKDVRALIDRLERLVEQDETRVA